jgi:hypothetical protein
MLDVSNFVSKTVHSSASAKSIFHQIDSQSKNFVTKLWKVTTFSWRCGTKLDFAVVTLPIFQSHSSLRHGPCGRWNRSSFSSSVLLFLINHWLFLLPSIWWNQILPHTCFHWKWVLRVEESTRVSNSFFSDDDFFIDLLRDRRQGFDFRQSGLRLCGNRIRIGSGAWLAGGFFPSGKAAGVWRWPLSHTCSFK